MSRPLRQRGATLIELVMTMVVVSVAVAAVLLVLQQTTARSADPAIQAQAQSIATAYLEEILQREYADPDGSEAGETRATYDDVDDYHALAGNGCVVTSAACPTLGSCACDQFGNPVAALAGYTVSVNVATTTLNGATARRVDVTVGHARFPDLSLALSGYRGAY